MSAFSVIMLALVSYFAIGGIILGLISSDCAVRDIVYWPTLVFTWCKELVSDIGLVVRELFMRRKNREVSINE